MKHTVSACDMYRVPWTKKMLVAGIYLIGALGVSYLFYESFWGMVVLAVPMVYLIRGTLRKFREQEKRRITLEFKDFLEALSGHLYAGNSLENSYIRATAGMSELYQDRSHLKPVLEKGCAKLKVNINMEQVLQELAADTGIEDVSNFANLTSLGKKSGGNLLQMIRQATGHISDKIKMEQEIATMIAAKKMEQQIMCVMPFAMLLYMKCTSPGYFDGLYHNAFGILFMSGCLLLIFVAYIIGNKIMALMV